MKSSPLALNPRYFTLILCTLLISGCKSPGQKSSHVEDFVDIFNGKNLQGWVGDTAYWRVEDGNLVGELTSGKPLEQNTFIIWQGGQPGDFELKAEFRITTQGNSGINYRSETVDSVAFALRGYQADIDGQNHYTGQNYEERGRTTLAYRGEEVLVATPKSPSGSLKDYVRNNAYTERSVVKSLGEGDSLGALIKPQEWNSIHLIVEGNSMRHYVNNVLMSAVTDNDTLNRKLDGALGIQVHVGPPMKVEYRKLRLKQQ